MTSVVKSVFHAPGVKTDDTGAVKFSSSKKSTSASAELLDELDEIWSNRFATAPGKGGKNTAASIEDESMLSEGDKDKEPCARCCHLSPT